MNNEKTQHMQSTDARAKEASVSLEKAQGDEDTRVLLVAEKILKEYREAFLELAK